MKYEITHDKKRLILTASDSEREELRETDPDVFGSYMHEADSLERLIANSELEWICPEECGDLTDAPILGYRDSDRKATGERWAFMQYQIKSFLHDLRDNGTAVFTAP